VIQTSVPVFIRIVTDEDDDGDGFADVARVQVDDSAIPATIEEVLKMGGTVEDENGLTVKREYSDGTIDPDWDLMVAAYNDSTWPSWEFGW